MSASAITVLVFLCVFGSARLGRLLRRLLPDHHLSQDSKDVVKLATGLIAALAALVLGLLVSSAKSRFDHQNEELVKASAQLVLLDRTLAYYGPETHALREELKRSSSEAGDTLFSGDPAVVSRLDTQRSVARLENLQAKVRDLVPNSEIQRGLQARALTLMGELSTTRWLLFMQRDTSVPFPLLAVLVLWLAVTFASFGLLAPGNATVTLALLVCALSVSGGIFLMLEMNRPFVGLVRIPAAPLRDAIAHLGQ